MGIGVAQHEVIAELVAYLARRRSIRFVKAEGRAEILERGPERLVVELVPVVAVDDVGAEKYAAKAQLLDAAARFGAGVVGVKGRNHAGADELLRIGLAKFVQPVVVRASKGGREFTVEARNAEHVQAAARIKNRQIDAFLGHGVELHLGRPAAMAE